MKVPLLFLLTIPFTCGAEPVDLSPVNNMITENIPGLSLVGVSIALLLILVLIFVLISTYLFGFVRGSGFTVIGTSRGTSSSSSSPLGPPQSGPPPPGFF